MRAYAVSMKTPDLLQFVGSGAEGRQLRVQWMKEHSVQRKHIDVKLIDVPTSKVDLIGWLNIQFGRAD
jgi:hypothetical protein